MLLFFIGMMVGGVAAVGIMALCAASKKGDGGNEL